MLKISDFRRFLALTLVLSGLAAGAASLVQPHQNLASVCSLGKFAG